MAPNYTEKPDDYKRRSKFILIPLHFLFVWVIVVAMVTAHDGFCTDEEMFPSVVYLTNGLFILIFVFIIALNFAKY